MNNILKVVVPDPPITLPATTAVYLPLGTIFDGITIVIKMKGVFLRINGGAMLLPTTAIGQQVHLFCTFDPYSVTVLHQMTGTLTVEYK